MKASEALKNFHAYMIKTYGEKYTDHWTRDDRETYEILASKVRIEMLSPESAGRSSFLNVFMTGKREPEYTRPADRRAAWERLVARAGTQVVGKLSKPDTYGTKHAEKVAARRAKEQAKEQREAVAKLDQDIDSSNIMAYLLSK